MPKPNDWLNFSRDDLRLAKIALNQENPLIGGSLYHAQQCAEKALKAYLVFNNQRPPRTHDLSGLLLKCSQLEKDFNSITNAALALTPFSTLTRYPDDAYMFPDLTTARIMIEHAEKILNLVENKIC